MHWGYPAGVRTTLTLPDDLLEIARSIARDRGITLGEVITDLARKGLAGSSPAETSTDEETGLPLVRVGHVVTSDEVRSLEDE